MMWSIGSAGASALQASGTAVGTRRWCGCFGVRGGADLAFSLCGATVRVVVGEIIETPKRRSALVEPQHVRWALEALAFEGGDLAKAADRLALERGVMVTAQSVAFTRDRHPELWVQVNADEQERLEAEAERRVRANAIRAAAVVEAGLDRITELVPGSDDLVAVAKATDSASKAQSTSVTALMQLSGRPVNGRQELDLEGSLRALAAIAPHLVTDGSAVEESSGDVPAAVVVESGQAGS